MGKNLIVFLVYILLTEFAFSQITPIKEHVNVLCSKDFHGRGYVNSGDSIAAAYIKMWFAKNGIKPINESYYQNFAFDVNTFPEKMEVVYNGKKLIPGTHFLVHPSSNGGKNQLVPKKLSLSELLDVQNLSSKLLNLKNDTLFNAILLDFSTVSADTLKLLQPIGEQISSYFPIIEITNKKFTWSVSDNQFNFPYIQIQDSIYQGDGNFDIDIRSQLLKNHLATNVIGFVPSKHKSEDYILFTAHYDHLGQMGENTYFPGANDNASGTALLLELANKIKQKPLKVNAVFIAFAGEEAGLIGSNYFVNNPLVDLDKVRFLINTDIMGSGEEGITVVNATAQQDVFDALVARNSATGRLAKVNPRGPACNSDHCPFVKRGVPAIFIYTMGGIAAYHDVLDRPETLPLTDYKDVHLTLVDLLNGLK